MRPEDVTFIRKIFYDKRKQSLGQKSYFSDQMCFYLDPDKKFLLVYMLSSRFDFIIYVVRVEIVIFIDSGVSFCKITLIVQLFTANRCTLSFIESIVSCMFLFPFF